MISLLFQATGKQYSFDLSDVPTNAEYLEVRYGVSILFTLDLSLCSSSL